MRRRTLLCSCGIVLSGLAGCSDSTDDEEQTPEPTGEPEPTVETTSTPPRPGPATFLALQSTLIISDAEGIRPRKIEKTQYLTLDFDFTDETPPVWDDITFQIDDRTIYPMTRANTKTIHNGYGERYTRRRGKGWLIFELPARLDGSDARVRWPGGTWTPTERIRERLEAPPPSFSVDVAVEHAIAPNSVPEITATVRNEDDIAGRFVGVLYRAGPVRAPRSTTERIEFIPVTEITDFIPVANVSEFVPANNSKKIDLTESDESFTVPSEYRGDDERDYVYCFEWPKHGGYRLRPVQITSEN